MAAAPSQGSGESPLESPAIDVEVLGDGRGRSTANPPVDEALLLRLLRRAGRTIARPAIECFELLIDGSTPHQVRVTVLAALTYLLLPLDLIPDFIPAAGFSDDLVALTALLGLCTRHISPDIRARAQRRLDQWFPVNH
ncbi:MAG: DUF1232 domain-containing protein [Synechococcaceae cyanobacterium]|jgi:uncharacterized membrane protein YkvA (DUF1232 family)|nr:DUF1232 domain-containing protein [Synechococcaceae cyanobacterium]